MKIFTSTLFFISAATLTALFLTAPLEAQKEKTITVYFYNKTKGTETPTLKINVEANKVAIEQNVKQGEGSDTHILPCDGKSMVTISDFLTNQCQYMVKADCTLATKVTSQNLKCRVDVDKNNPRVYRFFVE